VGFYGNRESSQHNSRFARLENRANIISVYKFYCYQKGKFFKVVPTKYDHLSILHNIPTTGADMYVLYNRFGIASYLLFTKKIRKKICSLAAMG